MRNYPEQIQDQLDVESLIQDINVLQPSTTKNVRRRVQKAQSSEKFINKMNMNKDKTSRIDFKIQMEFDFQGYTQGLTFQSNLTSKKPSQEQYVNKLQGGNLKTNFQEKQPIQPHPQHIQKNSFTFNTNQLTEKDQEEEEKQKYLEVIVKELNKQEDAATYPEYFNQDISATSPIKDDQSSLSKLQSQSQYSKQSLENEISKKPQINQSKVTKIKASKERPKTTNGKKSNRVSQPQIEKEIANSVTSQSKQREKFYNEIFKNSKLNLLECNEENQDEIKQINNFVDAELEQEEKIEENILQNKFQASDIVIQDFEQLQDDNMQEYQINEMFNYQEKPSPILLLGNALKQKIESELLQKQSTAQQSNQEDSQALTQDDREDNIKYQIKDHFMIPNIRELNATQIISQEGFMDDIGLEDLHFIQVAFLNKGKQFLEQKGELDAQRQYEKQQDKRILKIRQIQKLAKAAQQERTQSSHNNGSLQKRHRSTIKKQVMFQPNNV